MQAHFKIALPLRRAMLSCYHIKWSLNKYGVVIANGHRWQPLIHLNILKHVSRQPVINTVYHQIAILVL
jgi:hypothetical protein